MNGRMIPTAAPFTERGVTVHHGDCLDVLAGLPDASVDAVVTDPPYGLEFMGKDWDAPWKRSDVHADARERRADDMGDESMRPFIAAGVNKYQAGRPFQEWVTSWAVELLRVLRPGGHVVAFGGTRTYHRLAAGLEDAGFEIRDCLAWLYGSGFPKSHDVAKAIDRAAGVEREATGPTIKGAQSESTGRYGACGEGITPTAPATEDARRWEGWGTALKPAFEPAVLARKPLEGTVAANVTEHGTGALNIDATRVGFVSDDDKAGAAAAAAAMREAADQNAGRNAYGRFENGAASVAPYLENLDKGRFPANVVLDSVAAGMLDASVPPSTSRKGAPRSSAEPGPGWGMTSTGAEYNDRGGPSRFFYTSKASAAARLGSKHPTVKPIDLMRWIVRLITPPGGVVLDPFAGTGTTGQAVIEEGHSAILIEREDEYVTDIRRRLIGWGNTEGTLLEDGAA